jgi:hypothetical protein
MWDVLEIDFDFQEIFGEGIRYKVPEFFEPSAIPLNVPQVPDWIENYAGDAQPRGFEFDPTYRHVKVRGHAFTLGPIQANVVRLLHEAAVNGTIWRDGKSLLAEAGSRQLRMNDLFKSQKDWDQLIESDVRGQYRLCLD